MGASVGSARYHAAAGARPKHDQLQRRHLSVLQRRLLGARSTAASRNAQRGTLVGAAQDDNCQCTITPLTVLPSNIAAILPHKHVFFSFFVERPNVITYSAAISACDKGGQYDRALGLLSEMIGLGLEADVVSYNAAISATCKGKQWASALSLLQQMRDEGLEPNGITFNAAISACEKGGQWTRCLMLLEDMRESGHHPDVISFNR